MMRVRGGQGGWYTDIAIIFLVVKLAAADGGNGRRRGRGGLALLVI